VKSIFRQPSILHCLDDIAPLSSKLQIDNLFAPDDCVLDNLCQHNTLLPSLLASSCMHVKNSHDLMSLAACMLDDDGAIFLCYYLLLSPLFLKKIKCSGIGPPRPDN
jgi:hypothetical protein